MNRPSRPRGYRTNTTLYAMVRYIPVMSNVTSWQMNKFRFPTNTLMMIDSTGDSSNNWAFNLIGDAHVKAPNMPDALNDRHRGTGNAMFLDTHVEAVKYGDYVANIPATTAETWKRWTFLSS
jgi:prepilin-type processing-associated H-X9-DG protein